MKMKAKLIIALAVNLVLMAVLVVPQIIEAKRSKGSTTDKSLSVPPEIKRQSGQEQTGNVQVGNSVHNDTSAPLRDIKPAKVERKAEREANENPKVPGSKKHIDSADPVVQSAGSVSAFAGLNMPSPLLNFDGVPFPGVACNCAPPDTNGEVGATQHVDDRRLAIRSVRNHNALEWLWRCLSEQR